MHVLKPNSVDKISKFGDGQGTRRYVSTKICGKNYLSKR